MRTHTSRCGLLVVAVIALVSGACGSKSATQPSPTPTSTPVAAAPAPAAPILTDFRITGTVTDESGQPLANITVYINYGEAPMKLPVRVAQARTDGAGRYELNIRAMRDYYTAPAGRRGTIGLALAGPEDNSMEWNVQYVFSSTSDAVQNFRLASKRPIDAGDTVRRTFNADTTLCLHDGDDMLAGNICTFAYVRVPSDGLLTVTASADDGSSASPTLIYVGDTVTYAPSQGPLAVKVKANETARIAIEVMFGGPVPRTFTISTSLR